MRALFLSYDGMTDPLGPAQVMPYLRGLVRQGHEISLISCEKPDRMSKAGAEARAQLLEDGIDWHPLAYHKRPPILSTVWDARAMRRKAFEVARARSIELVHCRSYITALVGLRMKRELGLRMIFDMRGFWADERVDGGLWNLRTPHYRMVYRYFKRKELEFIAESDRVVSLTHAGRDEMLKWKLAPGAAGKIDIIPCCADLAHFDRGTVARERQAALRRELSLAEDDYVVSYLGSLGTWYMLDEMLEFFRALLARRPGAKFLFITRDDPALVDRAARRLGIDPGALRVRPASRAEVPALLSLSRLGLFFIKPAYSKLSSSPTKMAEILAMGIPVVTNSGVGDTDWIASKYGAALVMKGFDAREIARAVDRLPEVEALDPGRIRSVASDYFALEKGVEAYHRIYSELERGTGRP